MIETQTDENPWPIKKPTALLVLTDGTVIEGNGLGATGQIEAEVCFNTALTGYQEILTDPSYLGQIITFTFPHIGNVGTNDEDIEDLTPAANHGAVGAIFKTDISNPSNYRSMEHLDHWLKKRGIIALCGIDTRALTIWIRQNGVQNAIIAHSPDGDFDLAALKIRAANWPGLDNLDLAIRASSRQSSHWTQTPWVHDKGFAEENNSQYHIAVIDFGVKRNILRLFAKLGCKLTILPAKTSAEDILALHPDGIFLSNGPGDPAATGEYATPTIEKLIKSEIPIFGICLGHQILALALGAKTIKMHQGHHGANHPVKDHTTNKVEIVSMNHGFVVDRQSLPDNIEETHISLFDDTNCGLRVKDRAIFSVQHHPEASPGPQDSHYLFHRFISLVDQHKNASKLTSA